MNAISHFISSVGPAAMRRILLTVGALSAFAIHARAQPQRSAGGSLTGVTVAPELLVRGGDTAIVAVAGAPHFVVPVVIQGSGACGLAVQVNGQALPKGPDTLVTLPARVNATISDTHSATTIQVIGRRPCSGSVSQVVYVGGELASVSIASSVVDVGTLAVTLTGRGTCRQVLVKDSRTGTAQPMGPSLLVDRQPATAQQQQGGLLTTQPFTGGLQVALRSPGPDTITVSPLLPCIGAARHLAVMVRTAGEPPGMVTGIYAAGGTTAGLPVSMQVTGNGSRCRAVVVSFGDGTSATVGGPFPIVLSHVYSRAGHYSLAANASTNPSGVACSGSSTASVVVQPVRPTVTAISAPASARMNERIGIALSGRGPTCTAARVDFGDGTQSTVSVPGSVAHTYTRSGTFAIRADGVNDCVGTAGASVIVAPGVTAANSSEVDKRPAAARPTLKP
jgi:hypothetical protein